jgi:N-acetylneuraminic acid mutarotase
MMYVLGGIEKNQEEVDESMDSVLKFDCRMQTWSEVAIIPEVRDNAGACVLGSDIYIFGGNDENYTATSTTYRFSTATNEWATLAPMPEAKSQHSVSVLNGLICILGGLDSDDDDECINSVHRFDPTSNLWSAVAPMSVARASLGSFVMDGIIYAVSGFSKGSRLSSMERYSVALDSWSDVRRGELGAARSCFGAVVVQVEVDFFDSLIAKAQSEGLSSAC